MAEQQRTIPLDSMSLEELHSVKQQEEQRLNVLTTRYGQLRQAAARLHQSTKAIQTLGQECNSTSSTQQQHEIMVPLTESVYVSGKIIDPDRLLVELGTGYFAETSADGAKGFLDRKRAIVDANSENLTKAIAATRQNITALNSAMQGKLLEIRAKQEGVRHRAALES